MPEETAAQFLVKMGIDGKKWAKEFMRLHKQTEFPIDEELMMGWFANAIMAGMDEQRRRSSVNSDDVRELVSALKQVQRIISAENFQHGDYIKIDDAECMMLCKANNIIRGALARWKEAQ